MKNNMIIFISAILICLMGAGSTIGLAQDLDKIEFPALNKLEIPKVERVTLDNGIRLYLIEDKSLPTFEARVRVNCGGYLEPLDKIGLAGICGTVMRTGGTSKWSGDELDEILEGIGGSVDVVGMGSGEAGDDRPRHLRGDARHRLVVTGGRSGKAGLDYVYLETGELMSYRYLVVRGKCDAGRLLAIAQCRVEDDQFVGKC